MAGRPIGKARLRAGVDDTASERWGSNFVGSVRRAPKALGLLNEALQVQEFEFGRVCVFRLRSMKGAAT